MIIMVKTFVVSMDMGVGLSIAIYLRQVWDLQWLVLITG